MGKDGKSCELGKIGHSEPLQWEKIQKVANREKLAVLSHSEPLWWEKIGKVMNWEKLAIPSHSEPLQWEKIGKVANQAKSNFSGGGVHWLTQLQIKNSFLIPGGGGYIAC